MVHFHLVVNVIACRRPEAERCGDPETQRQGLALLGCDKEGFTEEVSLLKEGVVTGCKGRVGKDLPGNGHVAHQGSGHWRHEGEITCRMGWVLGQK